MPDIPMEKPASAQTKVERIDPPQRVILLNDEITPMEFVVRALQRFFGLDQPTALDVMYTAHFHGSAHVATLPQAVANQKISMARFAAGIENYPLIFSLEPEDPAEDSPSAA